MKRTLLYYVLIPAVIAVAVFLAFLAIKDFFASGENKADYAVYDGQTVRLVVGSRLLSPRRPPIIKDNEISIDLDTVKRYIDGTVYWDEANKKVTVTTRDRLVRMNTDSLTAFVNDRQEIRLDLPVFEDGGAVYLPMRFLSEYFQIRISYEEKNKVVIVDDRRAVIQTAAVVEKGAVMRLGRSVGEPIVKRFANPSAAAKNAGASAGGGGGAGVGTGGSANAGGAGGDTGENAAAGGDAGADGAATTDGAATADVDSSGDAGANVDGSVNAGGDTSASAGGGVNADESANAGWDENAGDAFDLENAAFDMYIFEEYDGWYKARSLDGVIGYIEKRFVAVRRYVDKIALADARPAAWKPENGKIVMVWEQVSSRRANPDTAKIPGMPGLDVVSPTWFSLTDKDGAVESRASADYIDWARMNGYKVWALFSNTMNDIEMTSAFLNDGLARENAIRALLAYAAILEIDGINLDFENVYLKDKDALTQFVRELAPMLREQGLTFSVDVNIPDGSDTWSRCYDTPSIAAAADYVNLMAYDQHGAKSQAAGSVSQLSWVEANLKKLIERDKVPPEKIILGIPFYTRIWEMDGQNAPKGGKPVNSSAVGMNTAIGRVFDNNADVEWDTDSGQFFCVYKLNGKLYHVWLEEPHSVNLRSALAHRYALAGVSAWSRNFVIPEIWDVLNRNLKEIVTYYQWKAEASVEAPELARVRA